MVSTYMVGILRQKNVAVLHLGEVFGWGEKLDVMSFVGPDGVHLNDDGERRVRGIIQRNVHAFKTEREKASLAGSTGGGVGPEGAAEKGKEVSKASSFASFAGVMIANGISHSKPLYSLAGDL